MSEQIKSVSRQELYEAVWCKPITVLTKEWNTNYSQIAEACALMDVPRPSSGHWQVVARGYEMTREPLPAPRADIPMEMLFSPGGGRLSGTGRVERQRMRSQQLKPGNEGVQAAVEVERPGSVPLEEPGRAFDINQAAERAVLDVIRQARGIDFWADKISAFHYAGELTSFLGLDQDTKISEAKLVKALKDVRKDFRTFEVKIQDQHERYGRAALGFEIEIHLREGWECEMPGRRPGRLLTRRTSTA
jgi:hypothetical protein